MPTPPRPPRVSFVTGINENYFLMAGVLGESLDRYFPLIPFYVMDFGLSVPQQAFFRAKDMLLEMPAGLAKGDHPFKLKSCTGTYLPEDFGTPVWVDADMIALRDGTGALRAQAEAMAREGRRFALAPDQGSSASGPQTIAAYCRNNPVPALAGFLREHPDAAQRPYLNTGLVMFRAADRLDDWRERSAAFFGEPIWEQNAFNAICHAAPELVAELDARVWNAHGPLLSAISGPPDAIACAGAPCIFAHATSPDAAHISWGEMSFEFAGMPYRNFVKFFTNPTLKQLQQGYMNDFLGANLQLLRELGVFAPA